MTLFRVSHLRRTFLWRWWNFFRFIARGVRVHPTTVLDGRSEQIALNRGTKIGARVNIRVSASGELVLSNDVWLSHDVEIESSKKITIGAGTTVQRRATINGSVSIGSGCIIAPNVFISSGTHPFRAYPEKTIREQERLIIEERGGLSSLDSPISIGDDCWLGVNVVICPGVNIGRGVVIGANSVVLKDVPNNTVVAGVPAKAIGTRC
ncbi:MAG: acetyltransferase [Marinobacter sp.]|nr:acetyltransferase [Marinobacter sp.]|tara:strand:+ start:3499 stop:4122 length:624 start_codon:yes stop_codon:yes gene_type:complete